MAREDDDLSVDALDSSSTSPANNLYEQNI